MRFSSGRIGLVGRCGILKGLVRGAGRIHRDDLWIGIELDVEASRIGDLRHEIDVGQSDPRAEVIGAGADQGFDGIKTLAYPMSVPFVGNRLIVRDRTTLRSLRFDEAN